MNIVSRYIAVAWLRMLLLCQAGFLAIYLILDFMEKFGRVYALWCVVLGYRTVFFVLSCRK